MNLLSITKDEVEMKLSESELLILNAALNEVCNGINVAEFETRIGAEKDVVVDFLNKIGCVLDKMSAC
mgnify:CR=1 FL=1